jgi:hypothetical protein
MNDENVPASSSFDVRFMKKGKHSVILFLPETYHAPIGLIIAYWGNFELTFDFCLEALITAEAADGKLRETSGWKRLIFKRRRKIFEEVCKDWLAAWNSEAALKLQSILALSSSLHAQRNIIAHGIYGYTIPSDSSIAQQCYAQNLSTGRKMFFDERVLKKIYHDISHITADLIMTFGSIGKVQGPFYAISDEEILRTYRETVHPWNPNPKKRPK